MELVAALVLARQADARRMSAGRLDGPVEASRPSLWHRAGRAVSRTFTTRRTPAAARPAATSPAAARPAAASGGCATA